MFNNLISNGIKYRNITGDKSKLRLNVFNDKDKAIIHIQDNGIEISSPKKRTKYLICLTRTTSANWEGMGLL
ncbi:MAG: ATP-binding protein [Bacteroidia bacterium]